MHAWIREPRPRLPASASVEGLTSHSPSEVAEECLEGWAKIWGAEEQEEQLEFEDWASGGLSVITGERLRRTISRFRERTGVGMCGWHPRDWDKLGDEGLETLAELLQLAEAVGRWPGSQQCTAMIRIGKEGGAPNDYRLIGMMTTLYRVWAKLRRQECMEWEERNFRKYDFACKGRGAASEVWDVALVDEGARVQRADTACWAADLSKFYERIPLQHLVGAAKDLGFPSELLRLALRTYRGRRFIQYEKAFSSSVFARRGIIAGCSLATTLVKVFMWRALDAASELYPSIRLRVYLDDILLQWVGHAKNGRFVPLATLVKAVCHYSGLIVEDLEGQLNTGKTCLISSSRQVLKMLGAKLRGMGVMAPEGCRLLGVDYGCGARRGRKTGVRRKEKALRKCSRIRRLGRTGADRGMLWATGVGSSVGYGAEVFGINGHDLQSMRRQAGSVGLPGGGRSLSLGFLCHKRRDIDPMWSVGIAPAIAWCKEAWRRTGQLGPMRLAWQHAHNVMPLAKRLWSNVVGPATSTWASLKRLGWEVRGPFEWVDSEGGTLDLLATSPVKMKKLLIRAAREWTLKAGLKSAGFEVVAKEAKRVEWDWVKKILHGSQGGPAEERGGVRATIDGSAWTESRLWKAGYRERQECACGHEVGNTPHRLLRCSLHKEDRDGMPGKILEDAEAFLEDGIMEGRVHRLLPIRRRALPEPPSEADTVIQEIRWGGARDGVSRHC